MTKQYWSAPALWPGACVVCIAGGPSLTPEQVDACRGRSWGGQPVRVIAINDAYRLAPWADALYFCDDKWWEWHRQNLGSWGGLIARLDSPKHDFGDPRIRVLRHVEQSSGLSAQRDALHTGTNSGYQAINLSVHLGARRIVLLGYDMHVPVVGGKPRPHWFGDHPVATPKEHIEGMRPYFRTLVEPLSILGVEVLNATPGSALEDFPRRGLEEALAEAALQAA